MKTAKQAFRIISSIVYILAVIFVVDTAFGAFMHGPGKPHDKLNYMIDGVDCDVLIVGSSRAFRHYDAKMMSDSLGLKVYNAGLDGVNSTFIMPVLESMLRFHRPKMIVYEVLPTEFTSSWANKHVGMLKPMYGHTDEISQMLDISGFNEYNVLKSNLIKFNSPLPNIFSLRTNYSDNYGFEPLTDGIGNLGEEKPIEKGSDGENRLGIDCFIKVCKRASDLNIPIVAVISPWYSNEKSILREEQIVDSLKLPFFNNFSLRFGNTPSDYFADLTHLNINGAELYTKHFIGQIKPYLEKYGILPATEPSDSSNSSERND